MRTGQRVVAVRHCVTVAFLDPFFMCAECRGNLIIHIYYPTVVGKFAAFSVKMYISFLKYTLEFVPPLGVVEYSQDRMPKINAPAISSPMAVFKCVFVSLKMWMTSITGIAF